ncbi:MAG: DUF2064 domain-containing protein [Chitinophagaceae bacterium]
MEPKTSQRHLFNLTPVTHDTAVLIFSRFAAEEARAKGYQRAVGKKGGLQLAGGVIGHTIREARLSGLPIYTFFSDKQTGQTFGERLANSIDWVYDAGFENVIVIGTDCPSLTADTIITAAARLKQNAAVLGPSPDGGTYLIAMHRSAYCRNSFLGTSWLTADVFDHLKRYFKSAGVSFHILPVHTDIDHWSGLLLWQQKHASNCLSLLLTQILAGFLSTNHFSSACRFVLQLRLLKELLRGPPGLLCTF